MNKNNQNYEFVGKLNPNIAKYWKIEEHANKPIIIFYDRKNILLINI